MKYYTVPAIIIIIGEMYMANTKFFKDNGNSTDYCCFRNLL